MREIKLAKAGDQWIVRYDDREAFFFDLKSALAQIQMWAQYEEAILDDKVSRQ